MSVRLGNTKLAYHRVWHEVSAKDRILGRLATSIAITLMGKHKPIFHPATDCGDYVVVKDCQDIIVTGKKLDQHIYYSHSTKPGHLKKVTMRTMKEKKGGGETLRRAVSAMLPKNRLRDVRLERLKTFEGSAHSYQKNIMRRFDQVRHEGTQGSETKLQGTAIGVNS